MVTWLCVAEQEVSGDPGYRKIPSPCTLIKEHGIHGSHSGSASRAVQQLVNLALVLAGVNWDAGLIAMVLTGW